jgi:fatty-acid desaturase
MEFTTKDITNKTESILSAFSWEIAAINKFDESERGINDCKSIKQIEKSAFKYLGWRMNCWRQIMIAFIIGILIGGAIGFVYAALFRSNDN